MINREAALPIVRQCELLELSRSSVYCQPRPVSAADLALMRRLDELRLAHPFLGARKLAAMLKLEGLAVGRRHVRTLLRRMGLEAIYRKRRTSLPEQGHTLYPYLLSGAASSCRTKCGRAEVTYLPMARGFLYLVEILDLASRKVLAWRPSNTLATDSCVEALQEALNRFGSPEIFNTDQGAQFAASAFSAVLQAQGIRISMDGKGRWIDNVFVERLWRSVKYEAVYLHAYESPREANGALERYFEFYNGRRPHQALDGRTPEGAYSAINEVRQAA